MSTALKNLSDFSHTSVPNGEAQRFGVIVAEWNAEITKNLYDDALKTLQQYGVLNENIISVVVPGSFELIAAAEMLLNKRVDLDVVICLGCVIQGETRHFDFIGNAVANGLGNVAIKHGKPVIFGILTTDTLAQAFDRAGGKHGNKGIEAAVTALKMAALADSIFD